MLNKKKNRQCKFTSSYMHINSLRIYSGIFVTGLSTRVLMKNRPECGEFTDTSNIKITFSPLYNEVNFANFFIF